MGPRYTSYLHGKNEISKKFFAGVKIIYNYRFENNFGLLK